MSLLDASTWTGKIYSRGWTDGSGRAATTSSRRRPASSSAARAWPRPPTSHAPRPRAEEAQRAWAARPYNERAAVLRQAGDLWHANAEEITGWLMRETGAIGPFGGFQIMTSAEECYEAAALASAPYGELLRSALPRLSMARRVPVGVVGVISPFNVPTILAIRAVAPALALGNAVLLKPDPRTAVSGGALLAAIFAAAGPARRAAARAARRRDVGEALVTEPLVRVIAFTGSTRAGRAVGALAGQHLKRVHLELGGNSALLVLDDVDVGGGVVGRRVGFVRAPGPGLHGGRPAPRPVRRSPTSTSRRSPRGRQAAGRRPGHRAGRARPGHRRRTARPDPRAGDQDASRRRAAGQRRDVRGPLLPADRAGRRAGDRAGVLGRDLRAGRAVVRFDSVDDAVRLAADTPYGLSLGILTSDVMRGLEIAERIPSGLVHINDQTVNDEASIPFGGVRDSGTGPGTAGRQANLDAFTDTQWVTVRGRWRSTRSKGSSSGRLRPRRA